MPGRVKFALTAFALLAVSQTASAAGLDGPYRGTLVCEKMRNTPFQMRLPLDIVVTGKTALAVRPIINPDTNQAVGTEIGTSAVGDDGAVRFSSSWKSPRGNFIGDYAGTITEHGGTLIGTQSWTLPNGGQVLRHCTAAFVQARN